MKKFTNANNFDTSIILLTSKDMDMIFVRDWNADFCFVLNLV